MIVCPYDDCKHSVGWTHRHSELSHKLNPPEGDFFDLKIRGADGGRSIMAFRWDDNLTGVGCMNVLGCPKCLRMFMDSGQIYLD